MLPVVTCVPLTMKRDLSAIPDAMQAALISGPKMRFCLRMFAIRGISVEGGPNNGSFFSSNKEESWH
jgi:hypothetical protein